MSAPKVTPEMKRALIALKHEAQRQGCDYFMASWADRFGGADGDGLASFRMSGPDGEWATWKEGQ